MHGLPLQLEVADGLGSFRAAVGQQLSAFAESDWPPGVVGTAGWVVPYDGREVLRHVSPAAEHLGEAGRGAEVFREREFLWLVDDRWGIAEVNFIRRQWRAWVLPGACDGAAVDGGVLWPMAQLLRVQGLHLVPAAAVSRAGWSALILAPFGIEPELSALVRAGYRIVGQRWTAMREEDGRVSLLHMPGWVECAGWPRKPATEVASPGRVRMGAVARADLHGRFPGSVQRHAFCDAVVVVSSGRRSEAAANGLSRWEAGEVIRRAWPIAELHPTKRGGTLAAKLGQQCQCAEARLSARGEDMLGILDALREGTVGHGSGRVTVYVRANQWRVAV